MPLPLLVGLQAQQGRPLLGLAALTAAAVLMPAHKSGKTHTLGLVDPATYGNCECSDHCTDRQNKCSIDILVPMNANEYCDHKFKKLG